MNRFLAIEAKREQGYALAAPATVNDLYPFCWLARSASARQPLRPRGKAKGMAALNARPVVSQETCLATLSTTGRGDPVVLADAPVAVMSVPPACSSFF